VLTAFVAAAAACGQQGPLTLPADSRPIERIDPATGEPQQQPDDERQDER
jgi:predicted small lipoprotein YifL